MPRSLARRWITIAVLIAGLLFCAVYVSRRTVSAQTDERQKREELYRLNNVGVALMEQFKHEQAAASFKQALARDPGFIIARANLALADYFQRTLGEARTEALAVLKVQPDNIRMHYVLGLIDKTENKTDAAIEEFAKVVKQDPADVGANVNLGQSYTAQQKYDQAVSYFQKALESEPYNATAAYSLATSLLRLGKREEGQQMMTRFQTLRASGYATSMGNVYFEQGRYSEAVTTTGAEADLVSKATPDVRFSNITGASGLTGKLPVSGLPSLLGKKITQSDFASDATKRKLVSAFGGSVGFFDYDNDGNLDAYLVACDPAGKEHNRLFHNDGKGKFTDVTDKAGVGLTSMGMGAVFGDYDNDGKTDILVINYGPSILYHNNGDGTFTDVSAKAGLPTDPHWTMTAAFVDYDHDGDLDIFLGNFVDMSKPEKDGAVFPDDFAGDTNILLRNNGNGTFTDITDKAGVGGGIKKTTAIVCTDFNNQRDIDMYVVNYGSPNQLFSNQRDGSFKDVAADRGVADVGKGFGVAVGDTNKDGYTDFYLPHTDGPDVLYLSDGHSGFTKKSMPGSSGYAAQFVDYDNDGLVDVLTVGREGLALRRNVGSDWADVTEAAGLGPFALVAGARFLASGDLDGDGGTDLVISSSEKPVLLHNDGAGKNGWMRIDLRGATSNKSAVGCKVDIRSGSLQQKYETYSSSPMPGSASLIAGLGYRNTVDAVRIIWPSGVVQSEVEVKVRGPQEIQELDRKGTSCPLLYTWNGERFQFVTDFLGGSAIGYLEQPGEYNYPDTDEYIRVTGDQLRERDGNLSIRMNNQLEEVIYFDAVRLMAIDHRIDSEMYPNERLMPSPPYPPLGVFLVKNAVPPVSAVDDHEQNILPAISNIDRAYAEGFKLLPFKGYAEDHSITLDLGATAKTAHPVLLLTAWIDYADSSSNLAAAQSGARLTPPYLQVKNKNGEWQTVIPQMGFPAGLPKTMTVDLTGKFLSDDTQIRIVTSMRIYWDQILVAQSGGSQVPYSNVEGPVRATVLRPLQADLRWVGFPREYSPDSRKPLIYDYQKIEATAPWKAHLGNYTRLGDVTELLQSPDDMYVITRNGDEIQIDFDASKLPPLPKGLKRDYLIYANGFGKDMDINSARPYTIGPLPFHKMSAYPYPSTEHYPADDAHRAYLEKYNTRTISK